MNRNPRQRGPLGRSLLPGNRPETTDEVEGECKAADPGGKAVQGRRTINKAVQGRRTINKGGK
jgi:hypothetical protein